MAGGMGSKGGRRGERRGRSSPGASVCPDIWALILLFFQQVRARTLNQGKAMRVWPLLSRPRQLLGLESDAHQPQPCDRASCPSDQHEISEPLHAFRLNDVKVGESCIKMDPFSCFYAFYNASE
jgi:hypothetical protein